MEQLNVITAEQATKLAKAVELLAEADVLMQEGLGACDFCYEAHTMLKNLQDDLTELADRQQEF